MPFRLRELGFAVRLGITCLVIVFAGGFAASVAHLVEHHHNRDERPGVSLEDLQGAYHGVRTTSPLLLALNRDHPEDLPEAEREILASSCMPCHSHAEATEEAPPLEYWEDISKVAFSREVEAVPVKVLAASTHTHALTLAGLGLIIGALWLATRWPRALTGGLFLVASAALLVDLACWWLARDWVGLVVAIAAAGAVYVGSTCLMLAGIVADLWLPGSRRS
jgi:hypothetical protein